VARPSWPCFFRSRGRDARATFTAISEQIAPEVFGVGMVPSGGDARAGQSEDYPSSCAHKFLLLRSSEDLCQGRDVTMSDKVFRGRGGTGEPGICGECL